MVNYLDDVDWSEPADGRVTGDGDIPAWGDPPDFQEDYSSFESLSKDDPPDDYMPPSYLLDMSEEVLAARFSHQPTLGLPIDSPVISGETFEAPAEIIQEVDTKLDSSALAQAIPPDMESAPTEIGQSAVLPL